MLRWLRRCGGVLLLLAAVVLVGRFAGIEGMVTLTPNGVPMAFPTVVGFLLAGIVFWTAGRAQPWIGRTAAVLLLVYGVGTLVLYAVAGPLGWEQFLYDPVRRFRAAGVGFDGRMAPNTALGFALIGFSMMALGARRLQARPVALAISVLLAMSVIAFVSHVTGLRFTAAWWRYTAMALHTAAGFLFVATSLLYWLMRRMAVTEPMVTRAIPFFIVAGTSMIVLSAVVLVSNEQRIEATRWMNRTLEVGVAIDRFITSVARYDAATRAYALTGHDRYLERVKVHREAMRTTADLLTQLTGDNPPQQVRALSLIPLIEQKILVNEEQVQARRDGGAAAAAAALQREPSELPKAFQAVAEGLQQEERRVLQERRADSVVYEARLQWVLSFAALATIGLVGAALSLVHRAQRSLTEANDQLEARVRERTTEVEGTLAQLAESERRLRFLADTMPQLVWTARPDGTFETLNRGWLDYLGVSNEADAIRALPRTVHREDVIETTMAWREMRKGTRAAEGEVRLRRKDGMHRWHLWRAHPERDRSGQVVRWVGTCTDIHDQILAAERLEQHVADRTTELRASEERFRQAFEFAGIGMAIVGLDGRWVRVNNSICEIVGYSEPELLQKTFQDITHPDDLATDLAHLNQMIEGTRRRYQMEKRYFHREGHIVWVRLTVSMVRDAEQRPVHFISQIEDITERKQLQENLASARDQALEASRLKSEFLATMSHEIRTPMNGVIGMTALLRDTPLTPTQAEYVHTIESSGESLLTIINDILDYSKIEAGRIELEVSPFNLRQCIEDALDLFVGRALEKKIELMCLIAPEVPTHVAGDVTRVRQILVNLLGNAVKFTEKGEVVVTVDVEPADGRQRLRVAVKDTGIGISREGRERLFKSFSQVDASTTRRFGGTGLGLAISKRLAEVMGGTMWVESEVGRGSTFYFTVVVDVCEAGPAKIEGAQPELKDRRLLIVDDNPTNRRVVSGLATSWGMQVREATGGPDALARLREAGSGFDVAVLDMHMPEMSGEELAQAMHALPGQEALPLVLLTSLGRRTHGADFMQTLAKPVKAEALQTALRAALRRQSSTGKTHSPFATPEIDSTLGARCPLRLLIAEDNLVNQRVASLLLQRLGYQATIASNGLEALSAMEMADYDAILMDVEMPELDGCETTRRIRALRGSATYPWIIALTAGAMQSDRERALGAGMNDFLTKPVRTETLSAALERAHSAINGAVDATD